MDLKQLAKRMREISEEAIIESSKAKGDLYGDAIVFFTKKRLPDGSSWGGDLKPIVGFDNSPQISRERRKLTKDGILYSAKVRLAPGKGGGAGIGVDPAASNHLFNMIGTSKQAMRGVGKAFLVVAKKNSRSLNETFRKWIMKPDNFIHNIVGWKDRESYSVEDVTLKSVRYDNPMIDPTRRQWPAGRTEIWVPVTAEVSVALRRKK